MSDANRPDAHPDSPPDHDDRPRDEEGSVESLVKPRSPLDGAGVEDGVAGTGGVNKAQDNPTS